MTVSVIRGATAGLLAASSRFAVPPSRPLYVAQPPGRRLRSFGAIRTLLHQLRRELPADRIEAVLERHAPAAELLLPGRARHRPADPASAGALAARPTSHMTHNFILQHPAFEAWAALFVDLLEQGDFQLVVPSQTLLSWEDGALLKSLYRRFPDRAPSLVLGLDPTFRESPDEHGVVWSMITYKSLSFGLDFLASQDRPPVDLADLPEVPAAEAGLVREILESAAQDDSADPDDLDGKARAALSASPGPLERETVQLVVDAVRASFRAFGFTSAIALGLDLLARQPDLAPEDAADLHTLIGLAAHNRQFEGFDNPAFPRFLDAHFAAALERETRPAHRCALLYRLAVVHGRRRKDVETAIVWADRAVAASRQGDLPPVEAAYQETWSRNIRAYILMRMGRLAEAEAETLAGFQRIEGLFYELLDLVARGEVDEMWELDIRSTHSLLAFNTQSLEAIQGRDTASLARWLERSQESVRSIPAMVRFEAFHFTEIYLRLLRPDLALPLVLRGMEDARREVDALREYDHARNAVALASRLGDTRTTLELIERVQSFRGRCGLPAVPALEVVRALTLQREGRLDEARFLLEKAQSDPAHSSREAQAEIQAHRAAVEAQAGNQEEADRLLDRAIDLAVKSGDRDTLLRIAVAAGRCYQTLGRPDDAREAFEQALEIVEGAQPEDPPLPPLDLLRALLGIQEHGEQDPDLPRRILAVASAALDDPEAWWELPRVVPLLQEIGGDAEVRERILTAAGQRRDSSS